MDTVTIPELLDWLKAVRTDAQACDPAELTAPGTDEPTIDVRLQVMWNGNWTLNTGDASFDQDHRSYWGSSCVSPNDEDSQLLKTAATLINEAAEQAAQEEDFELLAALELALIGGATVPEGDGRKVFGPLPSQTETMPSYAWPGGYQMVYYTQEGNEREVSFEHAFCAACAFNELHYGDATETLADIYYEGPRLECYGCDKPLYAVHGDPECIVCDGEVSGLLNNGRSWDCPECNDPKAPMLWWMEANIKKACNG